MRICHSQRVTTSPHIPTHNIVLSHRDNLLPCSHLSCAFPTPGVLGLVFGDTAGPYLQSECLRRITSSRSPVPMVKLGRGGFLTAPQATFGQEVVSSLGRCRVTEESTLLPAGVDGGGLTAPPSAATEALTPPDSTGDSNPVRRWFSMSMGSPWVRDMVVVSLATGTGTVPKSTH